MHAVALTGGIGSGKSTAAQLFSKLGVTVISADAIAREIVTPNRPAFDAILAHLGSACLAADGQLNRAFLREHILHDPNEKIWLENLLHPLIRQGINTAIDAATPPYCMVEIPLLVESAPNPRIERVLVIDLPPALQCARASARDNCSTESIMQFMQHQADRQTRCAHADDIIDNSGDRQALSQAVIALHHQYLQRFGKE